MQNMVGYIKKTRPQAVISLIDQNDISVAVANTFVTRLIGLLGSKEWGSRAGIIIDPCQDIHTFGLGCTIDAVFLDKSNRVIKCTSVKPNRFVFCRGALRVLELQAGYAKKYGFSEGEVLKINPYSNHNYNVQ